MTPATRLVTVAHGTRLASGNEVARAVTAAAGELLGLPAVSSYVELSEPLFADVLGVCDEPAVAVPLLLSTGYHVRTDLPAAVAGARGPVVLGPALGPHRLLARAQAARLLEAGAMPGQPVVLVATGSTDPLALGDLRSAAALLADAWGGDVRLSTLGGLGDRPEQVVRPGDAVSPYLLADGLFARRCRELSLAAGATAVADVLGPHPLVVELVVRRARDLIGPAPAVRMTREAGDTGDRADDSDDEDARGEGDVAGASPVSPAAGAAGR